MVVAVLGTTISPYLFFWQASHDCVFPSVDYYPATESCFRLTSSLIGYLETLMHPTLGTFQQPLGKFSCRIYRRFDCQSGSLIYQAAAAACGRFPWV
jgi:hypothetical protein